MLGKGMDFVKIDLNVLKFIAEGLKCPLLDGFMPVFTVLGDVGICWIVASLVLMIFKPTRKAGFVALLSIGIGALITNVALKNIVARPRPYTYTDWDLLIERQSDWSFPSGHSTAAFAFATGLTLIKKKAWWVYIPAGLMALSRLYLFVHFPTDVLAGCAIGVLAGFVSKYVVNLVIKKYGKCKANG